MTAQLGLMLVVVGTVVVMQVLLVAVVVDVGVDAVPVGVACSSTLRSS